MTRSQRITKSNNRVKIVQYKYHKKDDTANLTHSLAFREAPDSMSRTATSNMALEMARCSAVYCLLFLAINSAPASISLKAISSWFISTASSRGVMPSYGRVEGEGRGEREDRG
jgi:hypothetical protein